MYIAGNQITIGWHLAPTASPLAESAYDIRIVPADLAGTYTDAGITSYLAPTVEFPGYISFAFTPIYVGKYNVFLTTGTGAGYTVLSEKQFWVFLDALTAAGSTKVTSAISRPGEKALILEASVQAVSFNPYHIRYGNGIWIASDSVSDIYYSTDNGDTWTQSDYNGSGLTGGIIFDSTNNQFVAITTGLNRVDISTNGANWTNTLGQASRNYNGVGNTLIWNGTYLIACGQYQIFHATSAAASWTQLSSSSIFPHAVSWGGWFNNQTIIYGNVTTTDTMSVAGSNVTVIGNWARYQNQMTSYVYSPHAAGADFVANVQVSSTNVRKSANNGYGTWTDHTVTGATAPIEGMIYSAIEDLFYIFDDTGKAFTTQNFSSFTELTGPLTGHTGLDLNSTGDEDPLKGWMLPGVGNNILKKMAAA